MEIIVIGAGIAGLVAASELARAGIKPIVIDARDRIGGRIYTIHDEKAHAPIELGAEFVHGHPPEIFQAVKAAKIEIAETGGNSWYLAQHRGLTPIDDEPPGSKDDIWKRIERYCKEASQDISLETFLQLPESVSIGPEERDSLKRYVAGFHAAEIDKVGIRGLVKTMEAEEAIGGIRGFRIPVGYDRLSEYYYEAAKNGGASFLFNKKVTAINWGAGTVKVTVLSSTGITETTSGQAAIVALPVGVLKSEPDSASYVRFEPKLDSKTEALSKIEMGDARRVIFAFRSKWWNEILTGTSQRKAKLGFLFAQGVPISVWWSSEPMEAPLLTGWVGGRNAMELAKLGNDAVIDQAIDSLNRIFQAGRGQIEDEIISVHTYDWLHDPLSRGAYTYLGVGGVNAPRELAENIGNTLYFAGEATSYEGHWGTVHGAIASGVRAAREAISAL
ncbi:MAG TPA: NAD(P)/FAD-dependent oxidoreductase [Pyrinomonadaceae bacterium]|nr:NAD(P)/FAD-dependent oxidoreductase [Pyrinomonadaceae bacterium]